MEWAPQGGNSLGWILRETYIGKQARVHAVELKACVCDQRG